MNSTKKVITRQLLTSYLVIVIVFFSIWLPELAHYYVRTPSISHKTIDESRIYPSDFVMNELISRDLLIKIDISDTEIIHIANRITDGVLQIPGYSPVPIGIPFDSLDLDKGLPTWRFLFASLIAPKILLSAFTITKDDHYLELARKMILSWAKYEESKWLPYGFLWNDHAIAERITVISKFWHIYKSRSDFDLETAEIILKFISRSGEMLAKEGHFTFATNHGIMQNLALLQIATEFPALPRSAYFKQLAFERLHDQMEFYINEEGVVLEHSALYQEHGLILIDKMLKYLAMNAITPPQSWEQKYKKGKEFLAKIQRPDGTLPIFGNTSGRHNSNKLAAKYDLNEIITFAPHSNISESLYPIAGYSVWWSKLDDDSYISPYSQTVLVWSYFMGHGHKLADEMSVLLWADGQNWLTNTGYWPYGVSGRSNVDSWEGSNAPHLLGESKNSIRETELLNYKVENKLAVSHLRRTSFEGYSFDRQVIHLNPYLWVIIDYTADRIPRKTTTTWTFSHELDMTKGSLAGQYYLNRSDHNLCMTTFFLGSEEMIIERHRGSKDPFAGWVVIDSQPMAAPSLVVTQPSDSSLSVAVLSLDKDCKEKFVTQPKILNWNGPDYWSIDIPFIKGTINIERKNDLILVDDKASKIDKTKLLEQELHPVSTERSIISASFQSAAEKYKRYNQDLFFYRITVTYILLALFLLQEILFLVLTYIKVGCNYQNPLRIISNSLWIILGSYLFFVYLT
jgi:heparinase II/III-like protein